MTILLTPELENLIDEKVKSGLYDSPSDVVRQGLQLLNEQDQLREIRLNNLRSEIQKGIDDIRAGRFIRLETKEDFANFAEQIKREVRESRAQRRKCDCDK